MWGAKRDYVDTAGALAIRSGFLVKPRDFETAVGGELDMLFRVAKRMAGSVDEAEEIVQQTVIRAFQGWNRFDGARLRPWLLRILKNEFLARGRFNRRHRTFLEDEGVEPVDTRLWDTVLTRIQVDSILVKLDEVEPHYRLAIQLCDVEGLSYEEAADVLEVPIGTVRSRLYRGRNRLRELLASEFAVEDMHE